MTKVTIAFFLLWSGIALAKGGTSRSVLVGACHFEKKEVNCFEYFKTPSGLSNTKPKDAKEVCEKTGGKFLQKHCKKADAVAECSLHQPKDGAKRLFYTIFFRKQKGTDPAAQHKFNEQLCGNIGKMGRAESRYRKY